MPGFSRLDPAVAARLMLRDRSRIVRALEVLEATGRTVGEWHGEGMQPRSIRSPR